MKYRIVNNKIVAIFVLFIVLLIVLALLTFDMAGSNVIVAFAVLFFISIPIAIFIHAFTRGSFSAIITINEAGVEYSRYKQTYFLTWNKIKHIGINADKIGRYTKNCYIYFDARDTELSLPITEIDNYDYYYFGVQYREDVIIEISKFWDKPIINLDRVVNRVK